MDGVDAARGRDTGAPGRPDREVTIAGGAATGDPAGALPAMARDVVAGEGAAVGGADPPGRAAAWLFARGEQARTIALEEAARLFTREANFVWVDLADPNAPEVERVARLFGLPAPGVEATLAPWQPPRLDVFGRVFLVVATVPRLDAAAYRIEADQLDLFVDENVLVSAHPQALPLAGRALARARQNPEQLRQDASFLLYIILDELLTYYEGLGEQLEDEIERMEERALTDTSDAYLGDLLRLKRYVFALTRLAQQHREVFAAFLRPDFPFVTPETMGPYFQALNGRFARLRDALTADKEAVNGAVNLYVSHMAHRTNGVMKMLTMVSTTLLPATVILGFFGANNIQWLPALTQRSGSRSWSP